MIQRETNKLFRVSLAFLFSVGVAIMPILVLAAELNLTSDIKEIGIGQQFQVDLLLNTENEEINAIEGTVTFSHNLLEIREIRDGNSIVNFWIDKPRIATNKNTNSSEIIFSGITPGGYLSDKGLIFSLIFQAQKEGSGIIEIQDIKALLNDGLGTPAKITTKKLEFVAIRDTISDDSWSVPKDAEPPETFRPEIAKDAELFNGKYFLVFATQDKSSGISHYEVKESRQRILSAFGKWVSAESPYVLDDQELRSFVFVKAVDKAGNKRIARIAPRNALPWYKNYENWIIIIVGVLTALFAAKKLWRKKIIHE